MKAEDKIQSLYMGMIYDDKSEPGYIKLSHKLIFHSLNFFMGIAYIDIIY
jgi:hypothetical protein